MLKPMPIACSLTPEEFHRRRDALLPGLAARAVRREVIDDGVRLHFVAAESSVDSGTAGASSPASDIVTAIATVVDAERRCCKFLAFTLAIDANDGPITLTITAPREAASILAELLAEQH
jgi:hypothetical protein